MFAGLNSQLAPVEDEITKKSRLHPSRCLTIVALHNNPGVAQTDLIRLTRSKPTSMSDLLARLVEDGIVAEGANGTDARTKLRELTPAGVRLAKQLVRRLGPLDLDNIRHVQQ